MAVSVLCLFPALLWLGLQSVIEAFLVIFAKCLACRLSYNPCCFIFILFFLKDLIKSAIP